jgi:hypothetical protein
MMSIPSENSIDATLESSNLPITAGATQRESQVEYGVVSKLRDPDSVGGLGGKRIDENGEK